jgi:hypothetical protein
MDNGASLLKTALDADRAYAKTTGDYANVKSLAKKLGGTDRATDSASGTYDALNPAPLAKE